MSLIFSFFFLSPPFRLFPTLFAAAHVADMRKKKKMSWSLKIIQSLIGKKKQNNNNNKKKCSCLIAVRWFDSTGEEKSLKKNNKSLSSEFPVPSSPVERKKRRRKSTRVFPFFFQLTSCRVCGDLTHAIDLAMHAWLFVCVSVFFSLRRAPLRPDLFSTFSPAHFIPVVPALLSACLYVHMCVCTPRSLACHCSIILKEKRKKKKSVPRSN